ncbi:MAG: DUF4920 domain-containing protein [Psychrobium sp.]|nr:DUF4920 domain-containing protein [Psychrobium sp.]
MLKTVGTFFIIGLCLISYSHAQSGDVLQQNVDMSVITSIDKILNNPNNYLSSAVTIEGTVVAVCKKRGCWAEVATANGNKIRVKVKDGVIVIPMSARGKTAFVTGLLTPLTLTKQQAVLHLEHMAKDAGQSFDRNSVTGPLTIYQLRASAIKITEKG